MSKPHPLDSVERRLGLRFPSSFRATYAGQRVFTEIDGWEIHAPDDMLRARDGVAVGCDVGGNRLLLLPGKDGKTLLDTLWCWDHETRELSEVAKELAALLVDEDTAQEAATANFAPDAVTAGAQRRENYWDRYVAKRDLDVGGVCKFCGSGLADDSVCSVCSRRADEPLERQEIAPFYAEAARIVAALVSDGRLELVSASARSSVVDVTRRVLVAASGSAPAVIAAELLEKWDDTPEIAEVFAEESDLEPVILTSLAEP